MESHGLRLRVATWRKIEATADRRGLSRSEWLRSKIEALVELEPDVHNAPAIGRHQPKEMVALDG